MNQQLINGLLLTHFVPINHSEFACKSFYFTFSSFRSVQWATNLFLHDLFACF